MTRAPGLPPAGQDRAQREFLGRVLQAAPDITSIVELDTGSVVYLSRPQGLLGVTAERWKAWSRAEQLARVHPEDVAAVEGADLDSETARNGEFVQVCYRARHEDGSWHWLNRRSTLFNPGSHQGAPQLLCVTRDVTDSVQAEQRLERLALHDALTGLPNRALLIDRLQTALARSFREHREVAVLFCDIDGFKRINDMFGHAAGDAVLVEVGQRVLSVVREADTVARVGGDEFVLIVEPWNWSAAGWESGIAGEPGGDRRRAEKVGQRIVEALRRPIESIGVDDVVTASIGIRYVLGSAQPGEVEAQQVVQDADAAMYRAKSLGKNRAAVFRHDGHAGRLERGHVEHVIREALEGHDGGAQFTAAYQPVRPRKGCCAAWRPWRG